MAVRQNEKSVQKDWEIFQPGMIKPHTVNNNYNKFRNRKRIIITECISKDHLSQPSQFSIGAKIAFG